MTNQEIALFLEASNAYKQAKKDKKPSDTTRAVACKHPYYAYYYALHIDKGYHPLTQASVHSDTACWDYTKRYAEDIEGIPESEESNVKKTD